MKVRIHSIKNNNIVLGYTYLGSFHMKWEGDTPEIDHEYDIELEIEKKLLWDSDIKLSLYKSPSISEKNGLIILTGQLESVDHDGYAVLRMGTHVLPFILDGKRFEIGSTVSLYIDSISAYPIHY